GLGGSSPFKSIVAMGVGFALASIGMDSVSGNVRLTFEFDVLLAGVSFLIAVIGLFGIGELLLTMEEGLRFDGVSAKVRIRDVLRTAAKLPRYWLALLRSSAIGIWMGITPGGPTAASFMSYAMAKRSSRN